MVHDLLCYFWIRSPVLFLTFTHLALLEIVNVCVPDCLSVCLSSYVSVSICTYFSVYQIQHAFNNMFSVSQLSKAQYLLILPARWITEQHSLLRRMQTDAGGTRVQQLNCQCQVMKSWWVTDFPATASGARSPPSSQSSGGYWPPTWNEEACIISIGLTLAAIPAQRGKSRSNDKRQNKEPFTKSLSRL